jgi:toxin YoeB
MIISFTQNAWEDYEYWQATDKKTLKKINALLKDIIRSPFEGLGKPEALRFDLKGLWSRRIDREHRLVYAIRDDMLIVYTCRYYYDV